jgi:hypothetical protein
MGSDELALAEEANGPKSSIVAWRYDPRIDLNNDGTPQDVLVWAGPPIQRALGGMCGVTGDDQRESHNSPGGRRAQYVVVAAPDFSDINAEKTSQLIASPTGGLPYPDPHPPSPPIQEFIAIGSSIGIFEYRGKYYFDTFYDGGGHPDFQGKRAHLPSLNNYLAVFLRKNGVTSEVCEYRYDADRSLLPSATSH